MKSRQDDSQLADDAQLFKDVCDRLHAALGGPVKRPGVAWTPQNQLEAIMVGAGSLLRGGTQTLSPRRAGSRMNYSSVPRLKGLFNMTRGEARRDMTFSLA